MATVSKKHHFVPRSVLKNFAINENGSQLYVFDKLNERSYVSSIMDAGSENKFNTAEIGQETLNFEFIFDKYDSELAAITTKLLKVRNVGQLSPGEISSIKRQVIIQYLRTKINRDTIVYLSKRQKETIDGLGENYSSNIRVPNSDEAKLLSTKAILEIENYLPYLDNKLLFLYETTSDTPFIISDNPITTQNNFPFGGSGLAESGVQIFYPISANLCVAFWCSSIMEFINREKPSLAEVYVRILSSGRPIQVPESEVSQLNTLQLAYASRFVYGISNISTWATSFLIAYPRYRERETKITMGEMGKGPPPKPNMPAGDQLVIYTAKQSFMLAITLYPDQFSITFKTEDYRQLKMIQEDVPIVKAEVYRDGHTIRIIPNGVLREVDYTGDTPNKIGYKDPSIEALLSSLLKK